MSSVSPLAEYPRTVVLKDGLHLVLRPMTTTDAEALRALHARLPAGERWYLPPDGGDGARGHRVLALDGERVAALLRLDPGAAPGEHHVGTVGLTIDPDYRGRRLGTWMLLDAVHLAAGLGIARLVATVAADELGYLAALRRLDFIDEAILPDRQRTPDGAPRAVVVLAKRLHTAWTDF